MLLRRLSVSLVLAVAALVAAAPAAMAHTELESSDPADGASLSAAPQQVRLKFGEAVTLPADPVRVTGPGGARWTVGKATVDGSTVTAPVRADGPAGAYVLDYTVVSDDGDQVKGSVRFTLTTAAGTSSGAPSSSSAAAVTSTAVSAADQTAGESSRFPAWAWIALAVAVVAVVAGVVAGRTRRS
ncbi:copper resistance protein CopC [Amycolatopsis cynarae]|uniref:Copper resistance protein CopC n=1 Tax=Amycolatopsis cynarae TaxID=2995223 RepID=A0ABY7B925_9PSEU|nr:copper resistance CopC family protein [Amycolatopsis sp. HUAS 11-8]WAL67366.1 copper resistance protein CopC [Amycolatopsis sp. HUAS 11-8]